MLKKSTIGFLILLVIFLIAWFVYKFLFPAGPVLEYVPNPVRNRSVKDWAKIEKQIPQNNQRNLYFGDMHVHTNFSFDAYIGGVIADPGLAYEFAKGKPIQVIDKEVNIQRPLDFAAITDHSEYFGELYSIQKSGAPNHNAYLPRYFRSIGFDTIKQRKLFYRMLRNVGQEREHLGFFGGYETTRSTWDVEIEAAEKHYEPGKFTTFAAYEWTLGTGFSHTHRNVFFKNMMVPDYPISAMEAKNEVQLWASLERFRDGGATVMAVPHNTNYSEGSAFPLTMSDGSPIDESYVIRRNRNEPIAEIHQAKGNSEVASAFWGNDEFADFENYNSKKHVENDYLRWALKKGLEYKQKFGINPYQYGLIGSTDTHNGTPGNTEEDDDYIGNHSLVDSDPTVRVNREWILDIDKKTYDAVNPGGLMAVWATANTRSAIYEAMERRETYATSGGRIKLRVFAGNDFRKDYSSHEELVQDGYAKGQPMGSTVSEEFELLIWTGKDPESANLDRIQIIKGWYDGSELHEKIFTVALSDNRELAADGSVPDNGAYVADNGMWDKSKGDSEMQVVWSDPEFNPDHEAFYYIRVLELETPRWSHWDEIKYGVEYPEELTDYIRERAWSSPIWYSPKREI